MLGRTIFLLSCLSLIAVGCGEPEAKNDDEVIAQRFIHKYGYDVPKDVWEEKNYPGEVITTYRNGVTVTSHFEDGLKHGESLRTYPHSQTTETKEEHNRGILTQKTSYNIRGIPYQEDNFISPAHVKSLTWYNRGTPKAVEEYVGGQLLSAEYFNPSNEVESSIENGTGTKTDRDPNGDMVTRSVFDNFVIVQRETFHYNGTPCTSEFFKDGILHGPKLTYTPFGDPISTEGYREGMLHGIASYYQNGCKYLEIPYINGLKEGVECHFIDGDTLAEETEWHDDMKHGPSIVFYDGVPTTTWYFNSESVSHIKYDEMSKRENALMFANQKGVEESIR